MKHRHFPRYMDDADFTTNAPSYYEDLARKEKLIRLLAERIWGYEKILDDTLEEIQERFRAWDKNLEDFPEDVKVLLQQWLDDGTLDHIINDTIFNWKLDTSIFEQFRDDVTDELREKGIDFLYPPYPLTAPAFDYDPATGIGTDDTENIQAILDYAFNNNISHFIAPNRLAKITLPLIVRSNTLSGEPWWNGTGQTIKGVHMSSSGFVKVGNNTHSGYNSEVDGIDATIILYNDHVNQQGGQGTGIGLDTLWLENNSTNPDSMVVTGKACQRMNVKNLNVKGEQGLIFGTCYSNRFSNIVFKCTKNALQIITGTSNIFEFLYAPGCKDPFMMLSAYSNLLSVCADGASGTIFNLNGNGMVMSGCGCESPKAKNIVTVQYPGRNNNTATIVGLYFMRQTGDSDSGLAISDCSVIKTNGFVNVTSINIVDHQEIVGNSYLLEVTSAAATSSVDIGQISYYKNYSGGTTNPRLLYSKAKAGGSSNGKLNTHGASVNVRRNYFMPYLGSRDTFEAMTLPFPDKAIYLDVKDPTHTEDGTDISYEQAYNVGDVLLVNDPKSQHKLGWVVTEKNGNAILNNKFSVIPILEIGHLADRPTTGLYVGQRYFANDVGKWITVKFSSGTWVYEDGTTVV